jgi:hypothetical protein
MKARRPLGAHRAGARAATSRNKTLNTRSTRIAATAANLEQNLSLRLKCSSRLVAGGCPTGPFRTTPPISHQPSAPHPAAVRFRRRHRPATFHVNRAILWSDYQSQKAVMQKLLDQWIATRRGIVLALPEPELADHSILLRSTRR